MRRSIIVPMIVLAAACDSPAGTGSSLQVVSVEVATSVAVGDTLDFRLTTVNPSDSPITVNELRERFLNLVVRSVEGDEVWRSIRGPQSGIGGSMTIAPGQVDVWSARWPLVDLSGIPVPAGRYYLVGELGPIFEAPLLVSLPAPVDVVAR